MKTISTAIVKIAPILGFIVLGWLIFIKLPFLFFLKSMHQNKKNLSEDLPKAGRAEEKYNVDDYRDFQRRMKILGVSNQKTERSETKREEKKEQKQEQRRSQAPPRREALQFEWACDVFQLNPAEKISKQELKKRYFEMLRQNHPDKVASMGPEFKKLADRKTKEINKAYDTLKNKAS